MFPPEIVPTCAKKTDSEAEPQTEAVCVIKDEAVKALEQTIFTACAKEKDPKYSLIDVYKKQCGTKVPDNAEAINKCKHCACLTLFYVNKPNTELQFTDCFP